MGTHCTNCIKNDLEPWAVRMPKGWRGAATFHPYFQWVHEEPTLRGARNGSARRKWFCKAETCAQHNLQNERCARESSNWNFGQDPRINLLVIFNSSNCRPTTYFCQQLWMLERIWNAFLLVRNSTYQAATYRGATIFWQNKYNMKSLSSRF